LPEPEGRQLQQLARSYAQVVECGGAHEG
jgi:hypothetical protein